MRAVSSTYKSIIASKNTRNFLITINMTLDDGTALTITEADIMENSFKILTASSGQNSLDIGSAIIGKCQFNLENVDGRYTELDFFNATAVVWAKLVGDSEYVRLGFFTVDEPQIAGSLISLELLDYLWRFDTDLPSLALPLTAGTIVAQLCSTCGVGLETPSFHGASFVLNELPDKDMNCRELIQYLAMIGCNFCVMTSSGNLKLTWYDTDAYGSSSNVRVARFTEIMQRPTIGTDTITVTGVKFTINDTDYMVGTAGYVLTLENPLVTASNVTTVLNLIWDVLEGFTFRTFNLSTLPDFAPEVGDCAAITYKNQVIYSYITNYTFTPSLVNASLGAVTPTRTLTKRYSKTVQAAVEVARQRAREEIGVYDESVQRLNELALNAMGVYHEYEDSPTGGRIYYLSNKPITKNAQGQCSFVSGSMVYKMVGDGFLVSNDGGLTWRNGYNTSTGELIVTILTALRINAEQMYTGEMTVGGSRSGTDNPTIRVLDANNVVVCTINSQGIIMGSGYIASSDFEDKTPVDVFSLHGMKIDVNGKYIKSPHFGFNENGAWIDGEVNVMNHPITVRGDIELHDGSGSSVDFAPYDFRLSEDFYVSFLNENEDMEVTITLYQSGVATTVETLSVEAGEVTENTVELNHLIGQTDGDYYRITVDTSSSWSAKIDDAILAYMGQGGFRGFMQGIFEGYIISDRGRLAGMDYYNHAFDLHNSTLDFYSDTANGKHKINISTGATPSITREYYENGSVVSQNVAWGNKQNFIESDPVAPSGSGTEGDLVIKQNADGTRYFYRYENNAWVRQHEINMKVDSTNMPFNNIIVSTNDIGEGVQLDAGTLYLVYE